MGGKRFVTVRCQNPKKLGQDYLFFSKIHLFGEVYIKGEFIYMGKNYGIQNEEDIIKEIDKKRFDELSPHWQHIIRQIYPRVFYDQVFYCSKVWGLKKADIRIWSKNVEKFVSIKVGYAFTVHSETINRFVGFLRWLHVPDKYLETLQLYHYGDGTIDGTGKERKTVDELKVEMHDRIIEFNDFINRPQKLKQIIDRFISRGTPEKNGKVDFLYLGDKDFGIVVEMEFLMGYLITKYSMDYDTIHFGPFTYNAAYRGLDNYDPNNVKRHYCNIKWPTSHEDIELVSQEKFK